MSLFKYIFHVVAELLTQIFLLIYVMSHMCYSLKNTETI